MKDLRAISALILREMTTTYGRNPGGYIWAIIEPVAALSLLTIVFSLFFRTPPLGDSFILFYATGYLPFMMYTEICGKISQSIRYSRQLLFYPPINFMHAIIARATISIITHIIIFSTIITGMNFAFNLSLEPNYWYIVSALTMAAALGIGVGSCNCLLSTRYPVWDRIWSILNRPAFIIAGVIFLIDDVPEPFKSYLWYNPIVQIIVVMRSGFYSYYDNNWVSYLYIYSISLFLFVIGILFLHRQHRFLLNNL